MRPAISSAAPKHRPTATPAINRQGVSVGEATVVASRYELDPIKAVRALPGGQAARLDTAHGSLLLKRRPAIKRERLRTCHEVVAQLEVAGLPVAPPVAARDGVTFVILGEWAYDLAPWIEGGRFDESTPQAAGAGRALARLHAALRTIAMPTSLEAHAAFVPALAEAMRAHSADGTAAAEAYEAAWSELGSLGFEQWPVQMVHGDWHRGNVLFGSQGDVKAMLDFDELRLAPVIAEMAAGGVQFATLTTNGPASGWPAETDLERLRAFFDGYRRFKPGRSMLARRFRLAEDQTRAVAALMAQSLLAQGAQLALPAGPSQAGTDLLAMVARKGRWLSSRREEIAALAKS